VTVLHGRDIVCVGFNDWDNEPGMKFCSLAAQGLWFKMLGLAARSRTLLTDNV
jgi:hypothetical protein